jgi:UDP-N-acetylglucosamine acyltransferase
MTDIHSTALVDPGAEIGSGVKIGPYSIVGPKVRLGDGCRIHAHAVITGNTTIGAKCEIFPFASVGHIPQDLKFGGEESRLVIGDNTIIREHATLNPGTEGGGMETRVGSNCFLMVASHVAHDCQLGDHVVLANNSTLAGHCVVQDHAILGGMTGFHQFVRIGAYAFIGGMSGVAGDVIPFGMVIGNRGALSGLNIIGMRRHGFDKEQIHNLRKAYRLLFSVDGTLKERMEDVEKMFGEDARVARILEFIRAGSDRSLCVPKNNVE